MTLLRLSALYGILPDELESRLTPSQLNELLAFMVVWPDGADVMDRRFEALRMDIVSGFENLNYTMQSAYSKSKPPKPKRRRIEQFRLFLRGMAQKVRFDQMTQEEINQRMRRFAAGFKKNG